MGRTEIVTRGLAGRTAPVRRSATAEEVRAWMVAAAVGAASKTDAETTVLDVGEVLSITTWFVITSGRNRRQVKAIVDAVEEWVDLVDGPKPVQVEGIDSLDWVVVDYGDFVVHVFSDEARAFYDLERLYQDVPVVDWQAEAPT
jgi:ribosome-associated protein